MLKFKIILGGAKDVGKSSLIARYCDNVFNEEMMFFEGAIENENFPSGLSNADFRFIDRDGSVTNLSFVAGFISSALIIIRNHTLVSRNSLSPNFIL